MTQTCPSLKLCSFDYDFLTNSWQGAKGAAYNAVYEDLKNAGYVDVAGNPTEKGKKAIYEYVPDSDGKSLGG